MTGIISEYGAPDGLPVIYCHGSPGSQLEGHLLHDDAKSAGIRLLAYNRRGFGDVPFKRSQTLLGEVSDLIDIADNAGLRNFAIAGVSGGAATALAAAAMHADRVSYVASIGGWAPIIDLKSLHNSLSPIDLIFFRLAGTIPILFRIPFAYVGYRANKSEKSLIGLLNSSLSQSDKSLLGRDPALRKLIRDDLAQAFKNGSKGPALDAQIRYRNWGVRLEDISVPVHFYSGDDDRLVPKLFAQTMSQIVPRAELKVFENCGHFGLFGHAPTIFANLVNALASAR